MSQITDRLEKQADILFNNIAGWEESTLQRIGRRIKKIGSMSKTDIKTINNIADVKGDMDEIMSQLAKVTGTNIKSVLAMYAEALEEQHLANKPLYDYRGKVFVPFSENTRLQAIVNAYAKRTGETMFNLSNTSAIGFFDEKTGFTGFQKAYTDVLDKAVMQVTTGATDFHTAMRDAIVSLGGSGLRVNYDSGIARRLDTAIRQSVLWGAKQAAMEYDDMIGEELGCDGIEIDWHSNPRPEHEFMQGKQYVLGKARTINGKYFESADAALEALKDYGCLHYKTSIICGISEPRYSDEELKSLNEKNKRTYIINGKEVTGYKATQMMRRLETAIRKEKDIKTLAQSSDSKALVQKSNAKIRAFKSKYNELCDITGLTPQTRRMSTTRSEKIIKYPLQNSQNGGIINTKIVARIPQVTASSVSAKIQSAEYSTKLSIQQYNKHIKGTPQYDAYLKSRKDKNSNPQSILNIDEYEAQQIILNKAGTGIVRVDRKSNPKPQEDITCDKIIGQYYGGGSYHNTRKATIHYGKKGSHIVPIKGDDYD